MDDGIVVGVRCYRSDAFPSRKARRQPWGSCRTSDRWEDSITRKQIIQLVLILGVTVACIAYSVHGMDWGKLRESFSRADYRALPLVLLALVLFYVLKAWRWSLLLRPVKELSPSAITPALMIGFMANNLLPAHLGEFVRVWVLGRQFDLKKTPVLSTVVLERVFDLLAVLFLLACSLPFVTGMPEEVEKGCVIFGIASLVGVVTLIVYMTFTTWFVNLARNILSRIPFVPTKLSSGIVEMLETGAIGLDSVRNPRLLAQIAASSVSQWLLNASMIYMSCWAFGVDCSFVDALLLMGVIVFVILVPSTPGYFGVITACFRAVLAARVVEDSTFGAEDIVGASIFYHMGQWVPVTLVGLFFLNRVGLTLSSLREAASTVNDPGDETSPAAEA